MNDILVKSKEGTHFRCFHKNSALAGKVFSSRSDYIIHQIMKVDSETFLAELSFK